jgi:ABC-type Na+ transport system ATPase subunit NatA
MSDLTKEFNYYISHQREIVEQFNDKVVVIHDEKVVGAYSNELEATLEGQKQYKLGDFLVQRVKAGPDSFTQTFYSRVASG